MTAAIPLEEAWLGDGDGAEAVGRGLEALGWQVEEEAWEETLELRLEESLLQRWFAAGADYRRRLEAGIGVEATAELATLFRDQLGAALPQPMQHLLLRSRRP